MQEETYPKSLKTLPREKAFYFFTSIGNYTGESAASLKEFMEKIAQINIKSLEFHISRGDFEKWINEVLEDKRLAEDISKLQEANIMGDNLRSQLYATISKRYQQLTIDLPILKNNF